MNRIIECVPNFSEGRDISIIKQITEVIESVEGVSLLDVDPGKATNRTVITFVGAPEFVVEAAFLAVKRASEIIDMSKHHGEHPRFGATDVCPLIPVSGISMEETVEFARKLASRIGNEISIPVYCYENAAFNTDRKDLSVIRSGEYEGLPDKLKDPFWKPDFGLAEFNKKSGAIAVGARNFLIAYNINLNTTSVRIANDIALDVREKGRVKRAGNKSTGKIIKDKNGNSVYTPGTLKSVKAIGWYIKEYGIAQLSMNLTDISITSVHQAFDEVCRKADERGIRLTGSELIGLIPLRAMLEAGRHYLLKQKRSAGVSDKELIKIAIKSLGLNDLSKFIPNEKIIEYKMGNNISSFTGMSIEDFMNEVASESPVPGGGSVSAYIGSLGISLGTMVANLSAIKKGWEDRWLEFSNWAEKGKKLQEELLMLTDLDSRAFNEILKAYKLPDISEIEKKARHKSIKEATRLAIEVPFNVMNTAFKGFEIVKAMAESGNPNSVSDAGVGAMAIRSCILGAWLNVRINAASYNDDDFLREIMKQGNEIVKETKDIEIQILDIVDKKIS